MVNDTNNPPSGGTGDAVSSIEDIIGDDYLDDPETDNDEADDARTAGDADDSDDEGEDNSDPDDSEDDDDEPDDPDSETDDEEGDGPSSDKGRFVADNAKVRLGDGTVTTIAELKAGALRQGDYTRKTQELAREREQAQAVRQQVSQRAQQLDEQIAQVSWVLEQFQPQVPPRGSDPEALDLYHQQKAQYDQLAQGWSAELEKRQKAAEEHTVRQMQQRTQEEQAKLLQAVPQLADPSKRQAFYAEAVKVAADYGIGENELQSIIDHRFFLALRDLMKFRRAQAQAPKAKEVLRDKPRMNKGRKRSNPKATQRRHMREQLGELRKTGSRELGRSIIENLITE